MCYLLTAKSIHEAPSFKNWEGISAARYVDVMWGKIVVLNKPPINRTAHNSLVRTWSDNFKACSTLRVQTEVASAFGFLVPWA
jgi:hypothetical protein